MFQMQPVTSSQIASIGFDPVQKVMRVQFNRGGLYEYQNVEPETHASLMAEDAKEGGSVGSLFDSMIKKNKDKYPYQKV